MNPLTAIQSTERKPKGRPRLHDEYETLYVRCRKCKRPILPRGSGIVQIIGGKVVHYHKECRG